MEIADLCTNSNFYLELMSLFSTKLELFHPKVELVSTVSEKDLANFSKCWKQGIDDSCEPNSSMLGAKLVNDPTIKVVPYTKYYNFALVTTSMQGL